MLAIAHHRPKELTDLQEFTSTLHGLQQILYQAFWNRDVFQKHGFCLLSTKAIICIAAWTKHLEEISIPETFASNKQHKNRTYCICKLLRLIKECCQKPHAHPLTLLQNGKNFLNVTETWINEIQVQTKREQHKFLQAQSYSSRTTWESTD